MHDPRPELDSEEYDRILTRILKVIWCDLFGRDWENFDGRALPPLEALDRLKDISQDTFFRMKILRFRFGCTHYMELLLRMPKLFKEIERANLTELQIILSNFVTTWADDGFIDIDRINSDLHVSHQHTFPPTK